MRAFPILLMAALLTPAVAGAQDRQRVPPEADRSSGNTGGGGANQAVPRETPPPPAPAPAPAAPAQAASVPESGTQQRASTPDSDSNQAQRRQRVPPEARRNEGGTGNAARGPDAIPRPPNQPPRVDGDRNPGGSVYYPAAGGYNNYYYYPRRYYPYGYGAFGLGYFYYDPYAWGPAYGYAVPPFRGYGYGYPTGELRLDVAPRNAEVYVDGYYAGQVDDFDGVFQSLELEEGTYRIEIVAPGFATLDFNIRISPGRKVTYRGDLSRQRP